MNSTKHYCPECDQRLKNDSRWCNSCQKGHFKENFDNWTTGNKDIDDFIKYTQINAQECNEYLEWIPYSELINEQEQIFSEVGRLFSANWERGPKNTWDPIEGEFVAKRRLIKVALTYFECSPALFLKEVNYFIFIADFLRN